MRGKKAKSIRKSVYGEKSIRARRYARNEAGTITNLGLRRTYQASKKQK